MLLLVTASVALFEFLLPVLPSDLIYLTTLVLRGSFVLQVRFSSIIFFILTRSRATLILLERAE